MQGLVLFPLLIGSIVMVVLGIIKPKSVFPYPQKGSRFKAFCLPFLAGISATLLCLIIVIIILFSIFPPGGGHGHAAAGLAIFLLAMIGSLSLIDGIIFGILNVTRKEEAPIRWRGMAISFGFTGFFPAIFYVLVPAGLFVGGVVIALLPFIIIGGLIFLAYKLTKTSLKVQTGDTRENEETIKEVETLSQGEPQDRPFPAFLISVNITIVIPVLVSALFLITAFFILRHWSASLPSGGWIPMDGLIEIYSLIGLQLLASIVCVCLVFTFTLIFPIVGSIRVEKSIISGVLLTIVALLVNLFLDFVGVLIMGAKMGIRL